jgi:predicted ArsR family transcriptional regulator
MRWWETSIGGEARGRIIALLRRGERTVDELAAELGVTDNAVRPHLDLRAAAALLTRLGAELDVKRTSDGFTLHGHACPLADAVRADPSVCEAIRELVAGVTGDSVRECCIHDGASPRCRLEIRRTA